MSRKFFIFTLLAVVALIASCSTTRVLQEGEERLAKNKIVITNNKSFSSNDLEPYIKQNPNSYFIGGWNPFLSVYNWQNGKGKGWDKFVKKIGVAPVVFDSTLVAKSEENISKIESWLEKCSAGRFLPMAAETENNRVLQEFKNFVSGLEV